jgi:5'-methylthioadenosine phosphorylase
LVTDLDAGVEGEHGVTQEEVFRVFGENMERMRKLMLDAVTRLPEHPDDPCQHALDGLNAG